MTFKELPWWPGAYKVYDGDTWLGTVNERVVRTKRGAKRPLWFAHDTNFFTVGKNYPNRTAAVNALPKDGKVKKRSSDEIAGIAA